MDINHNGLGDGMASNIRQVRAGCRLRVVITVAQSGLSIGSPGLKDYIGIARIYAFEVHR